MKTSDIRATLPRLLAAGFSQEQSQAVMDLINGRVPPEDFAPVKQWIDQCFNMPDVESLVMCAINAVLNGHGVEAFEHKRRIYDYVNMGDTYTPTVICDDCGRFMVCSWGDIAEQ